MNRTLLLAAALALPLLGLGGLWLTTDRASGQGTEWDVPVRGYDPRDLLQGHYLQFQYDWPGLDGAEPLAVRQSDSFCLIGSAPRLDRVAPLSPEANCASTVRSENGWQGRLYASETEALRLQDQLRDKSLQGMIRIRVRPDGQITPLRITFRPRPPEAEAAPAR